MLESIVRRCGPPVHEEVATVQVMGDLRQLVAGTRQEAVRARVLGLVQAWAAALGSEPRYRALPDTLQLLRAEGWTFPPPADTEEAAFETDTAPARAEGDVCFRLVTIYLKRM